jgi:hypothetical protein
MRLNVGAVLCLFLALHSTGCRKALEPVTDDNQAPETWITAAPQDTITLRDATGQPIRPELARIPVRFHLYWAGSDRDGAVAGYYFAVVETIPVPQEGLPLPTLPGPKARDYRFTSKSDSIFIFSTSEFLNERQHAFFVYAVDEKGKPDPTPARFVFRAYDKFPPQPVITEATGTGPVYTLNPGGGVTENTVTAAITDTFELARPVPRDTVPSESVLRFRWTAFPTIPGTIITGYRYKLDEAEFNVVDTSVTTATYNTGVGADVVATGKKIFRLRAVGQSGWRGETTRYFQMNFAPDTWFAGPDIADPAQGWQFFTDGTGRRYYYRDVASWPPTIPNTMIGSDSVSVLPALRKPKRTFFEFYGNRVFVREEGDTVHMNSWVVFPSGGIDKDSPYDVKVGFDPATPVGIVTEKAGPNGSPVAFRSLLAYKLQQPPRTPGGNTERSDDGFIRPSEGLPYPVFDAASPVRNLKINDYAAMRTSGKAYMLLKAEDGDGAVDQRVSNAGGAAAVADRVDGVPGAAAPQPGDAELRSLIMTFYVNRAPILQTDDPSFRPRPAEVITNRLNYTFNLAAIDPDPLDFTSSAGNAVGGPIPGGSTALRRDVLLIGKSAFTGADTTIIAMDKQPNIRTFQYTIPTALAAGPVTVRVQLCDCVNCEIRPQEGRCVVTDIPVTLSAPLESELMPSAATGNLSSRDLRPGSAEVVRRRQ